VPQRPASSAPQSVPLQTPEEIQAVQAAFRASTERHNALRRNFLSRIESHLTRITAEANDNAQLTKEIRRATSSLKCIRYAKNPDDAIFEAVQLGMTLERIGFKPLEDLAIRGAKALAVGRKAHEKTYGSQSDRLALHRQMQTEVDLEQTRGISHNKACSVVAGRKKREGISGWSYGTLKKRTKST
jgi:hypothetical protein